MKKKSGIYKLTINNKSYVGCSINLVSRLKNHQWLLHNNRHNNPYLQNAYLKYNQVDCNIIEECDESEMAAREIYWIDKLNTYNGTGYNLTPGGAVGLRGKDNPMFGKSYWNMKTEEEQKVISAKISASSKGIPRSGGANRTGKDNGKWSGISTEEMKVAILETGSIRQGAKKLGLTFTGFSHRFKKEGIVCIYNTKSGKHLYGSKIQKVIGFNDET